MDAKDSEWGSLTEEFTYTEDPPLLQAKNSLRSVALRSAVSMERADAAVRLFQQQRAVLDSKLEQLLEEQKKVRFERKALEEKKTHVAFHENQLKEARIALGREKEAWLSQKKTEKRPQSNKGESGVATPAPIPADGETQAPKTDKRQSDEVQSLREQLKKLREELREKESRSKMVVDKAQRELAAATKETSELSKRCEDLQREVTKLKAPKPRKPTKQTETQTDAERTESVRSEKGETSFLHPDEASAVVTETRQGSDGKIQKKFADGRVEAEYPNGTHRVVYANGYSCVTLPNKDVRQIFPDGHSVYFYNETRTVHWVHPDGSQVIKFANGQVEKHQPDGSCKIKYVDGTVKRRTASGEEVCEYADGVTQKTDPRGNKVVKFPSGKEVEVLKEGKALE